MNIGLVQELIEKDGIVFLTYGGSLTQSLIAGMTEALEQETKFNDLNMSISNDIFTIFIELAQNMMNYTKEIEKHGVIKKSEGLILVGRTNENDYFVHSQNVVGIKEKKILEEKIDYIKTLDKDAIKKEYRKLRKEGRDRHEKGAGIGFYEIAKRCNEIDYEFKKINEDNYYFHFKARIDT